MGTRANLIRQLPDGTFHRIYTHWNGHIEHHGPILLGHYNTEERVAALFEHGDISSLDERCDKPAGHTYDSPVDGCTIYYGRDRGKTNVAGSTHLTLEGALEEHEGFAYVWQNGAWWVECDACFFGAFGEDSEEIVRVPLDEAVKADADPTYKPAIIPPEPATDYVALAAF